MPRYLAGWKSKNDQKRFKDRQEEVAAVRNGQLSFFGECGGGTGRRAGCQFSAVMAYEAV
jgi:hypothetical protein